MATCNKPFLTRTELEYDYLFIRRIIRKGPVPNSLACFLLQHEEAWGQFYDEFKVHMIKGLEEAENNRQ